MDTKSCFSLCTLLLGAARSVLFGGRGGGVRGGGDLGGDLVNSCSSSDVPMSAGPGGAGGKVPISHGFHVALHLGLTKILTFYQTLLLKLLCLRRCSVRGKVGKGRVHMSSPFSFHRQPSWSLWAQLSLCTATVSCEH